MADEQLPPNRRRPQSVTIESFRKRMIYRNVAPPRKRWGLPAGA
jgi:hypothetical protein